MWLTNVFLRDFITKEKIKRYVLYLVLFTLGIWVLRMNGNLIVLNQELIGFLGITVAFASTSYTIYTYSLAEKIRLYLTLPIGRYQIFWTYFFALFAVTMIQRISFLLVILVFTESGVVLLEHIVLLITVVFVTVLLNVGILLGRNKGSKWKILCNFVCLGILAAIFILEQPNWMRVLEVPVVGILGILLWKNQRATDLILFHNIKKNRKKEKKSANYFFRVLQAEKIYRTNTLFIIGFLVLWCVIARENSILFGISWSIGAVNTPFLTMLSGDVYLTRQVAMLPEKKNSVYRQYTAFLAAYFLIINSIILGAGIIIFKEWALSQMIFHVIELLIISLIEVFLGIYLEKRHRITGWQTKQELWKHPRKYLLPAIVFLLFSLAQQT